MSLASYDYNSNLATTGDQLIDRIAKCINLAQEMPERSGTPYVMALDECHQPDHVIGYLDRVDNSLLDCIILLKAL